MSPGVAVSPRDICQTEVSDLFISDRITCQCLTTQTGSTWLELRKKGAHKSLYLQGTRSSLGEVGGEQEAPIISSQIVLNPYFV